MLDPALTTDLDAAAGAPRPVAGMAMGALGVSRVDCLSDLHLQCGMEATASAFEQHLRGTPADAVLILGDLFDVWIGDDALDEDSSAGEFERRIAAAIRAAARSRWVGLMRGNRDFLLGAQFASACDAHLLADPTLIELGGARLLLTHGDAWTLADTDYQQLRRRLRDPIWQRQFLAQPLALRRAQAADMRAQSEAHHAMLRQRSTAYADVDALTAGTWLAANDAGTLIHGHTHRPAAHLLPACRVRYVLSDWDLQARPPRADVLRIDAGGVRRLPVMASCA